jgi:hypothetical protein
MRLIASLFIMIAAAGGAFAAEGPNLREACKADVASLCQGVQPGGGRIKECLKANKDKLSDGCKTAIAAAIRARKEAASSTAPATTPAQ